MKRVQREFPKHYANLANKKKVMASRPSLLHQCDSQSSWPAQQASAPPAPLHHPIFSKFQSEHVTQFLNHAHEHDREDSRFPQRKSLVSAHVRSDRHCDLRVSYLVPAAGSCRLYFEILKGIGVFSAGNCRWLRYQDLPDSASGMMVTRIRAAIPSCRPWFVCAAQRDPRGTRQRPFNPSRGLSWMRWWAG